MIVLFITGEDYSAMEVEQEIGIEEAYKLTVKNGGKLTIDNEILYADLSVLKFGDVDSTFITFIESELLDYDQSKSTNFYVIDAEVIK